MALLMLNEIEALESAQRMEQDYFSSRFATY